MNNQGTVEGRDRIMTGMFSNREDAEKAYQSLRDRGYTDEQISYERSSQAHEMTCAAKFVDLRQE